MSEIVGSVITAVAVGGISLVWFVGARTKNKLFYMPKCRTIDPEYAPQDRETLFDWIRVIFQYPNRKLLKHSGGLDAILFLKFLKYSFWLFLAMTIIGLTALVPVYSVGENDISGLDRYTAGHLEQSSDLFWVPLISVFAFTMFSWVAMYKLYFQYVRYMNTKLERGSVLSRTVLVTNVPDSIENNIQFRHYWETLYPTRVQHTILQPDLRKLEKLLNKQKKTEAKLKKAENPGKCSFFTRDQVEHLQNTLQSYNSKIENEKNKPHQKTQVGFVTFSSTATAMQAAQTLHNVNPDVMRTEPAPDPRGLRFQNFYMKTSEQWFHIVVSNFLLVVLFLFWSIPIAFISAVSNLETLATVPGLSFLVGFLDLSPWLKGLLAGLLPSLGLIIFFALLPLILYSIIQLRRWYHQKHLDKQLFRSYWLFLVLNFFLVFTISGSLFGAAKTLAENPSMIVESLAQSLPAQATFFINYIIVQSAMVNLFGHFARIPDFVIWKIQQIKKTPEQKALLDVFPTERYFAENYSKDLIIFALGMTYSSIAPIILPFVTLYFGLAFCTSKYNWVYVLNTKYEGVRMSRLVVDRIFVAVILYQLTTMGVLGLGLFPFAPAILIPLIATCIFRIYLNNRFKNPSRYLALENCPDQPEIGVQEKHPEQYEIFVHPLLRISNNVEQIRDDEIITPEEGGSPEKSPFGEV